MSVMDFWFILWGILIAFGLQVLYDGIDEYPHIPRKLWGGILIEFVLLIALVLMGYFFGVWNFLFALFAVFAFLIVAIAALIRTIFYRT